MFNLYFCILIPEFHFPRYNSCGNTVINNFKVLNVQHNNSTILHTLVIWQISSVAMTNFINLQN